MSREDIAHFFSDDGPEAIVANPLVFKAKLKIGADAYQLLSKAKNLSTILETVTAGTAGAGLAGGLWYAGLGTLGQVGLGLGLVSSPIGWIAAAGLGTGATVFAIKRALASTKNAAVAEIPHYINTPLDVMGASIVSLIGSSLYLVIKADNVIQESEKKFFIDYFVSEWGIDSKYAETQFRILENADPLVSPAWIGQMVDALCKTGDIKRSDLVSEILTIVENAVYADNEAHPAEVRVIEDLNNELTDPEPWYQASLNSAKQKVDETKDSLQKLFDELLVVPSSDQVKDLQQNLNSRVPTIWLLGKTGAGKSSLIKAISDHSQIPIGKGFKPCTDDIAAYDLPQTNPVLRFLDTRGLGEIGYDHASDIAWASSHSDLIVILCKFAEPNQEVVADALKTSKHSRLSPNLIIVYTAANSEDQKDLERFMQQNNQLFANAWGGPVSSIAIDLTNPAHHGFDELETILSETLPTTGLFIANQSQMDLDDEIWVTLKPHVIRYSGMAAISSSLPALGSAGCISIQGMLLRDISNAYSIEFGKDSLLELAGALGASFLIQQSASIGARSILSTIPFAGSAISGALGFATTYALAATASHFYRKKVVSEMVSKDELQAIYLEALKLGRAAGDHFAF